MSESTMAWLAGGVAGVPCPSRPWHGLGVVTRPWHGWQEESRGYELLVHDGGTGALVRRVRLHCDAVCIAFAPDGSALYCGRCAREKREREKECSALYCGRCEREKRLLLATEH